MNKKYLGINQPIPLSVLEFALHTILNGESLDKSKLDSRLKEYISGENRRNKANSHINLIQSNNRNLLQEIRKKIDGDRFLRLQESDRKIIVICLLANTFPVFYETMKVLAMVYKVQQLINFDSLLLKLSATYGSNRGIYNAVNAVLPMLVDIGLIKRVKPAIFEKGDQFKTQIPFLGEICVYTDITLSTSKTILLDDIHHRPWYDFFDFTVNPDNKFELLKLSELRQGYGYLEARII
jgi:hypothetical protein